MSWRKWSASCWRSRGIRARAAPRELTLREALVVACGYERQNIIEEVWAEIFDINQGTISKYIKFITPLIEKATEISAYGGGGG